MGAKEVGPGGRVLAGDLSGLNDEGKKAREIPLH